MFDSVLFKNAPTPGPLIDIGSLAEALLFYDKVAIVGNSATVKDLLSRIPPFILLSLLRDGRLEFHYLSDQVGIHTTQGPGGRPLHRLTTVSSPDHTIEKIIPEAFKRAAGGSAQARVASWKFAELTRRLDHSAFDRTSVLQALADNHGTEASVRSLLRKITPDYPSAGIRFNVHEETSGFSVDSNIDFSRLNELYHKTVPSAHSTITEAYILALLQGAFEATYFAGTLETEVAVHPVEQVVHAASVEAMIHRYARNSAEIACFTDVTLNEAHAVREAVNSGTVPFIAIVKLLDSADKFRHWLRRQPDDASLIKAYYNEATKNSWVEKLPPKTMRWLFFGAAGLLVDALYPGDVGKLAGVAISALDGFLMDKVLKGWTPHQFVEGRLKTVLDSNLKKQVGR